MKPVYKFLLILLAIALFAALLIEINEEHLSDPTTPERIPTYQEVVPSQLAVTELRRVLDPRDAGDLIPPRLEVVRVADRIVNIACPDPNRLCTIRAITSWQKQYIEHTEVVQERSHITSPEETLMLREADDITGAILYASLLRSQGFGTRVGITPYTAFVEITGEDDPVRVDLGCVNCPIGRTRYQGANETVLWIS